MARKELATYTPFTLDRAFDDIFARIENEVSNMFKSFMPSVNKMLAPIGNASYPKMNMYTDEETGDVIIEAAVPGRNKDNIEISLEKGYLTISGKTVNQHESKERNEKNEYFCREIMKSQFSRTVGEFPSDIYNYNEVRATMDNGLLTIRIPKLEKVRKCEEKKIIEIE